MKCTRWSLGGDVSTNPPLLADMGLSILQDEESIGGPTPTPPVTQVNEDKPPPPPKVLQQTNQNVLSHGTFLPDDSGNEEEFFVYKRRRLDAIGGDDKFNRMSDELILSVFRWLPKFMLARCAQVNRRWKRLAFDETLWRRLDLGGKTLKPGVVGRVILRGSSVLRLAKAEVSLH
ncbi:S-phase kinase-associated protein 2-like [Homarus americanus]|uniref:S-phase kinase-associated protein 2-like n=1 Tax=Homarus americanus TaxID=6706 RepID=UPI001C45EA62|nr:S-phase kinase-associated protein 2-like [Homarus americanus]